MRNFDHTWGTRVVFRQYEALCVASDRVAFESGTRKSRKSKAFRDYASKDGFSGYDVE